MAMSPVASATWCWQHSLRFKVCCVLLLLKERRAMQIVRPAEGEHFADGLVSIRVLAQGFFFPEDVAYLDLHISVCSPRQSKREQARASENKREQARASESKRGHALQYLICALACTHTFTHTHTHTHKYVYLCSRLHKYGSFV